MIAPPRITPSRGRRTESYTGEMPLFERSAELGSIRELQQRARESGRVVTVAGVAGTGKTTLIRAATADAPLVLRGLCDPLTTPRPLGPIREALGESGPVLPAREAPARLGDVEERLLAALGAGPAVLVIEDAQWIDAASVEVLRHLVRRIDALPVLLVLSYRDDAIPPGHGLLALLGDIARQEDSAAIRLGPLSVDAVAEMLRAEGAVERLDAGRVHALTGGNPFYVAEIAAHPEEELPGSVRDAILASTTGLAPDDLEILQTIAAAPDGLDDRLLPPLGIDVPVLRRLEATSLLSRVRHGVSFRHELARIAIAETAPPGATSALHGRLLAAFETIGSRDYAVLTHHAEAAGDADATSRYARLAADEAARSGAHTEAVAFLTLALSFPADPGERAAMLERLSTEQYMVSRLGESVESIIEAVTLRDRLGDAEGAAIAHDRRAIIEYYSAHRADAERHARLATDTAAGTEVVSIAQTTLAYLAYRRHDLEAARRLASGAREAAAAICDDVSNLRLDIAEAASDLVEGDATGRERLLASATTAMRASLDEIGTTAYSNLSAIDVENRRLKDAEAVLGESIPLTVELDIPICRQWQTGVRSRLHLMRGRWVAAAEDATAVLREHGAPLAIIWPHLVLAQLGIRSGADAREVDAHVERAWELAQSLDESLLILAVLSVVAERSWHSGIHDERLQRAQGAVDAASALPGTDWAVGDLAVWMNRLGRSLVFSIDRLPEPHRLESQGAHRRAASAWSELGLPFEAAMSKVHADDGDSAIGALAALTELDVPATAGRARLMLTERGLTALPRPRRSTTRANPSGLTNRQLEVARLVAQGFTNAELAARLYISPKTADHHVSAVLMKLGLPSRRDVVRRAASLGLA